MAATALHAIATLGATDPYAQQLVKVRQLDPVRTAIGLQGLQPVIQCDRRQGRHALRPVTRLNARGLCAVYARARRSGPFNRLHCLHTDRHDTAT